MKQNKIEEKVNNSFWIFLFVTGIFTSPLIGYIIYHVAVTKILTGWVAIFAIIMAFVSWIGGTAFTWIIKDDLKDDE